MDRGDEQTGTNRTKTLVAIALACAGVGYAAGRLSPSGSRSIALAQKSIPTPIATQPASAFVDAAPEPEKPKHPEVGDRVLIAPSEWPDVPVANEMIYYHAYNRTLTSGDIRGLYEQCKSREASLVSNGTRALLLEVYDTGKLAPHTVALVRIEEGPLDTKKVFLPATWLKPVK